jgi:hypothetical protein
VLELSTWLPVVLDVPAEAIIEVKGRLEQEGLAIKHVDHFGG